MEIGERVSIDINCFKHVLKFPSAPVFKNKKKKKNSVQFTFDNKYVRNLSIKDLLKTEEYLVYLIIFLLFLTHRSTN